MRMHLLDEEKRSEEHERLDQARKRILKETMNVSEAGFFGHMGLLFVWNGTMLPHVLTDPLFLFGVAIWAFTTVVHSRSNIGNASLIDGNTTAPPGDGDHVSDIFYLSAARSPTPT